MKRYVITHDPHIIIDGWRKSFVEEGIESSKLLDSNYMVDGTDIFSTFDKAEAEKEFAKHKCDCYFTESIYGYQAEIDYYEMSVEEGEIDDDGNFEISYAVDYTIAPFYKEVYKK